MRRPILLALLVLAAAALVPADAAAQYVSVRGEPWADRITLEPYAGVYFDNRGRSGPGFDDTSVLAGVRLGLLATDRARLIGDIGYARARHSAAPAGGGTAVRAERWLATAGAELDVVAAGDTRAALGVLGGAGWRRGADGYDRSTVVAPGFSIRQRIAPRADLTLGVRDYIFLGDTPVNHDFALSAGLSIR